MASTAIAAKVASALPAATAAAATAAAATAAAASPSAAVRRTLATGGNTPLRLAALFERVRADFPAMSRTHFREHVVRQMVLRNEVRRRACLSRR